MLKSHINAQEHALLARSRIPANSGHSLHKGTPREAFVSDFLRSHLPTTIAIGTGEIIDANSKPNEPRSQFDIVLYNANYPKLDFGGGTTGFLAESVVATIEVKSTLDKSGMKQAIVAARKAKLLTLNTHGGFYAGYVPPKIINYVVAYDGPSQMATVGGWIPELHTELDIASPSLPIEQQKRLRTASVSLDGVFVLGKGFLCFDNMPAGFGPHLRARKPDLQWIVGDAQRGSLLMLFASIQMAASNIQAKWINMVPYLSTFDADRLEPY